jgi:3-oxoacyl-[acyl-carrier-protein] synthase-3
VKKRAKIIGMGSYLPEKVLTNQDLEKMVDTSDEWITTRTGMKERRIADAKEFTSDMGAEAAKRAIEDANVSPESIDLILFATITPDYLFPNTACLIQTQIGAVNAAAVDLLAACTGSLYALSMAKAYVEAGLYRTILVVASEKLSSFVDYQDRNTCVLFGDGAAAAIVQCAEKGFFIEHVSLGSDGAQAHLLSLQGGGSRHPASLETIEKKLHYLRMEGREVFKHAVRRMEESIHACLQKTGIKEEKINWFIPHQANIRIIEALAKRFNVSKERVVLTIHKYGNTSASSVGIALDELVKGGKVKRGEHLLLFAFGGGLTYGAAILTCEEERS